MLLTVKDVAARLNVSASCVYQLVESGRLSHHRIGLGRGAIRVSEESISEYLDEVRHHASGERPRTTTARPKLKHLKL